MSLSDSIAFLESRTLARKDGPRIDITSLRLEWYVIFHDHFGFLLGDPREVLAGVHQRQHRPEADPRLREPVDYRHEGQLGAPGRWWWWEDGGVSTFLQSSSCLWPSWTHQSSGWGSPWPQPPANFEKTLNSIRI